MASAVVTNFDSFGTYQALFCFFGWKVIWVAGRRFGAGDAVLYYQGVVRAGGRRTNVVDSPPLPHTPCRFCFVSLHGQVSLSWCLVDVVAARATNALFFL